MEQPASRVLHSSLLKFIVVLLGGLCVVALCYPSATWLIHYYQAVNMVRGLPGRYSTTDYDRFYAPDLSSVLVLNAKTNEGFIWDYATQHITRSIARVPQEWEGAAWSPDKRDLLYLSENGLYLWDLASQKKVFSVTQEIDNTGYQRAVWSPDNTRIALVYIWGLIIRDAVTGKVLAKYDYINEPFYEVTVAWSPDGKRIALGGDDGNSQAYVRVLDAGTMSIISEASMPLTGSHVGGSIKVAWSPDGTTIAASFKERFWLVSPIGGVKARSIDDQYDGLGTGALAWSPDSKQLAFFGSYEKDGSRELAIWRIADLQKKVIYQGTVLGALDSPVSLYWPPQSQNLLLITDNGNQESLSLSGW